MILYMQNANELVDAKPAVALVEFKNLRRDERANSGLGSKAKARNEDPTARCVEALTVYPY